MNHMEMYGEVQVFTLSLLSYDCPIGYYSDIGFFFCLYNTAHERQSVLLIRRVGRGTFSNTTQISINTEIGNI